MKSVNGKLFVFEGLDGSGTTTQAKLADCAIARESWLTCEPTGSQHGKLARQVLDRKVKPSLVGCSLEEYMIKLFAADRLDHINTQGGIAERLSEGYIILCDRYVGSSFAYSKNDPLVSCYNEHIILPDLTIYLDVPVDVALERISQREGSSDMFENREKLTEVKTRYDYFLSNPHPLIGKMVRVDGDRPVEEVHNEIMQLINNSLEN